VEINQKRQPDSQPARDALSSAPVAPRTPRGGSDRQTVQRWLLGGLGVLGFGGLLLLAGCPGNLENPQRFEAASDTGPGVPSCLTAVFSAHCGTSVCHSPGSMPGGDLDLLSPGVASRLINVTADHADVDMDGGTTCVPDKYVDTQNPAASWLLLKLNGGEGTCGLAMPETGNALSTTELKCVSDWIASVAADAGTTETGGSGGSGGASSAGTGGASMSSSGSGGAATNGGASASGGSSGSAGSGGTATNGGSGGTSSGGAGGSAGRGAAGTSGSGGASAGTGGM
jgi:hypothetical protein